MEELWKPIDGYDGMYEVSNLGRIRTNGRIAKGSYAGKRKLNPRLLNPALTRAGYYKITLCDNEGTQTQHYVHRLVAKAFIPNRDNLPEIDHIDTNPANNKVDNLRWCTKAGNLNNSLTKEHFSNWDRTKTMCKNMSNGHRSYFKPVAKISPIDGSVICTYQSIADAARDMNCEKTHIIRCCKGFAKTSHGFIWRYLNTETNE